MKKPLQVSLKVNESSVVELTIGEKVQIDRLLPVKEGYIARRHGKLLDAGVRTLALEQGLYFFKTLTDANLKVVRGGVEAIPSSADGKDPWPEPPPLVALTSGDEPPGDVPTFSVE